MTSPADVLKNIENEKVFEQKRQIELLKKAEQAEEERKLLQKTVYDISNPSPALVIGIVLMILIGMYYIYVLYLKPDMTGIWYDEMGNKWIIKHCKFSNTFAVTLNNTYSGAGALYDNYVQYGNLIGVWDYADNIHFTNGSTLERLQ